MKMHERINTREKPLENTKSEKSFALSCNLKTHQKINTGNKPLFTTDYFRPRARILVTHRR